MPHQQLIEISGRVGDIFAHRFVIELAGGTKILADLGPKGAEAFQLQSGTEIIAAGEMKPSELKVARIGVRGGAFIVIGHKPKPHDPRHHDAQHRHEAEATPDLALKAVRAAGVEPLGAPRRKPKHFEVLGRRGQALVECHVEFDGHIRKEKPIALHDSKWASELNA